ncbi:MAG: Uma2 family endonuclease [Bacteroidota bacterium]
MDADTAVRPSIIIEILSQSTRDYDRGKKFKLYRGIPSLREYVMIDSESVGIEVYRINKPGKWELEEYKSIEDLLIISIVDVHVSLKEIYEGTSL